jgi:hypothetical protein
MSTIVVIAASDAITNSRADINANFSALNSEKIETSVLDTDTTLAANSDAKIATQKAVKTYVDAGGNVNASTTAKGIVEEATSAEMIAGTAAGATGARLFLNPSLVAETGNDKIVKTKSTGKLDSAIIPALPITAGATTKDVSSTTTTTIAHGLGAAPTLVEITAVLAGSDVSIAHSLYAASTQSSASIFSDGTTNSDSQTFRIQPTDTTYTEGTITVDATNISIAWAKTSTPTGTAKLIWKAFR